MKKAYKILLIVLGVVVGLLLAVNFLAGPIAKNYVEKHDKELIGREVNIDKVRTQLLFGRLKIKGLTLFEDDGITPFCKMDDFAINVRLRDLLKHRFWVRKMSLLGWQVNIQQNRTWFNFNSIVDHLSSDKPKKKKSTPYRLVFNDVTINKSWISYEDLSIGSEFLLRNVALHIPYVDLSNLKTNVGLDFCLADSATMHTNLRLSENAEEYFLDLYLNNLGVDIFEPYLQQSLAVDSLQGRLNMVLSAQGRSEHILDFDLTGDIVLIDLSIQDTLGNSLGHIDSIPAGIGRFNLNQNLLDFETVYLSGLNTAYIVYADSTSNFDLFTGSKHHKDTTVFEKAIDTIAAEIERVQERKTLKIKVEDLQVNHTHLRYEDQTLPDTFRYEVTDIRLASKNFNLNGINTVNMQASLNQVGKLNMLWSGSLHGKDNHDLTLMLSNVKLNDFSAYALRMFGYPLEGGTLSFRSQNKIAAGNLTGLNKVQIASPVVGGKRKDVEPQYDNIPLKLGFYLLTDKNNNVSIDLPVSGNINDPKFSYRKALLKVFGTLLVKVVTSPFRLFADDDIQYIPFSLLHPDFSAEEYAMIDQMANTLYTQPNLSVILEEQVNYEETLQQLCNMQLQRDYYLYKHPETDMTGIDFLTNEEIQSIKLNDKGLCDYAAQYSEKNKLSSKKDVASVAYALYHEKSEALIEKLMDRRNEVLSSYLTDIKGLTPDQVSVTKAEGVALKGFKKPSRYELHVVMHEDME